MGIAIPNQSLMDRNACLDFYPILAYFSRVGKPSYEPAPRIEKEGWKFELVEVGPFYFTFIRSAGLRFE